MYGRGNYTAPPGQGPYTNTPPFHQRPLGPPPPPPISQGPHPPPPSMIQQGLPPISSQVGHLGHTVYPQASPGLPQQGPPNLVLSSTTNSQPYLNPAPPHPPQPLQVHGTSQMQQLSHWTPNASFIPPTGLPSAPRVLPPPPSQGQTLFSNQVYQPAAGSRQAPAQPHPQASRFYASSPAVPPPPPPPLPSSLPGSPPLPPSLSPPSSSSHFSKNHTATHISAASESTFHPNVSSAVSKSSGHEMSASGSVVGVSFPCLVSNDVCDRDIWSNIVSAHCEHFSSDLPLAPPKPADGRIVRSIELLCQFIAKNGPEFENMTRLKECKNPEFKFLFGGEPGSEAAVAHEYFVWTKRKYLLEFRSVGKLGSSNSPITRTEGFSSQHGMTTDGGVPSSPTDSDMDMEGKCNKFFLL